MYVTIISGSKLRMWLRRTALDKDLESGEWVRMNTYGVHSRQERMLGLGKI